MFRHTTMRMSLLLSAAVLNMGCLEVREEAYQNDQATRCTRCHGDPSREGDFLLKSAPPGDLKGSVDSSYPGVGSHLRHLLPGETHEAIACTECHIIPSGADTEGHADDDTPAEVVFGPLSSKGGLEPSYDAAARSCSQTWCHGDADVSWTKPRSSSEACGTCHGVPPALSHPQWDDCSLCHGEVIDEERKIIAPELHVDGHLQVQEVGCSACHGSEASPAPPTSLDGLSSPDDSGVGAHQVHLDAARGRPLECSECHQLPPEEDPLSHAGGGDVSVRFSGVATSQGSMPTWSADTESCSNTWCHGLGSDAAVASVWTDSGTLPCDGCHGAPPPAPHPPTPQCQFCHAEVVSDAQTISTPGLHVNGIVEVDVPTECNACHGDENAAPPRDLAGNEASSFAGVGAHQTHVLGTELSRAVPCQECHEKVSEVFAVGHFDTPQPAELNFSGVATSYGAETLYEDGSCKNSYCHGADFQDERLSGGSLTAPSWTTVDGTQAACGTCHGLPPPLRHTQLEDCSSCHQNVRPDNRSFYDPSLHVNGIPELYLGPLP